MPKKVLTPDQQAQMLAGRMSAKQRRLDIRDAQESKADTLEAINEVNAAINLQLEAIKEDIVIIRKMTVILERAIQKDEWGRVFTTAAVIHAFAMNIARRIETCSAQAGVANTIVSAIRVKEPQTQGSTVAKRSKR